MTALRKVLDLMVPHERRQAAWLVPLVIGMAFAEVAGIAAIAPFLSLMADPAGATESGWAAWAYRTFGFEDTRSFLLWVGLAVMVVMVTANGVLVAGSWALYRFGSFLNHGVSTRLLVRYLQEPYEVFVTRNSSAVANNVLQEVSLIVDEVVTPGINLIAKGAAAIGITVLLIVIDPVMAALVVVLLGGAYGLLFLTMRRFLDRIGRQRVTANQERFRAATEAVGGMKDAKLAGVERELIGRFAAPSRRFARYQAASRIISHVPRYALEAVAFGSILAVVLALLSAGRSVSEIVPALGLYAFAGYRLLPALQLVYEGFTRVRYGSASLDEVHGVARQLALKHAPTAEDGFLDRSELTPLPFEDTMRFEGVSYAYPGSEPVLREVSLEIPARSAVAFVGTTGAGKTTLVDVLLGLLPASEGRIVVDGVPLTEETMPRWQMQVGYVPQSIFLTDDSVARNIAFGEPDERIDMEAVRRAARMAQIDAFVERELPDGYESRVGDRGVRLSGGQRQRIGIARALYRDPEVLVLDEATSALDGRTEARVFDAIEQLAGRKTLVMIAHRLATVRSCDRIFVLDDGRLVDTGRFDELARRHDGFRAMAVASEPGRSEPDSA